MTVLYHGTPISGTREDGRKFLQGRHGLVSYAYPEQIDIVKSVCLSYVLDNGAFTIWRKGGKLNPREFMDWAYRHSRKSNFNFAFIPDIIDGKESHNDALIELWKDESDVAGVPIWHLDESLGKLERLSHQWHTIAFGSSGSYRTPGTRNWWQRMAAALDVVCDDGRPRCRLHGLRMMDPEIFTRIPFSSVDSTNAAQNASRCAKQFNLPEIWQGATCIHWRLEQYQSPSHWHGEYIQQNLFCGGNHA